MRLAHLVSVMGDVQGSEALLEEAKVNDTTVSFEEFMRPQPPATVAQDASGDTE